MVWILCTLTHAHLYGNYALTFGAHVLNSSRTSASSVASMSSLEATSTRAATPAQERRRGREHLKNYAEVQDMKQNQRSVSSKIYPEELTATWDDQQIHGPDCDWHDCPVNGPTWDQLDERTRLKLKKKSAAKRAQARRKEEDEEATRNEQRRSGELFNSCSDPSTLLEADEDLSRAGSLTSDASASSVEPADFQLKLASVMQFAEEEAKSGASGANGYVLRAQWKGSVKVAIKVALGSSETIKQ